VLCNRRSRAWGDVHPWKSGSLEVARAFGRGREAAARPALPVSGVMLGTVSNIASS